MADTKVVEGWAKKGNEDFQYAKASLEEGLVFYAPICFHFHQAVEKYLKAYIISKDLSFQKIHDLTQLLKICSESDSEFNMLIKDVNELNPYYIEVRYPGFIGETTKSQVEEALQIADKVITFIKPKLDNPD